jgi:hypothetical protein
VKTREIRRSQKSDYAVGWQEDLLILFGFAKLLKSVFLADDLKEKALVSGKVYFCGPIEIRRLFACTGGFWWAFRKGGLRLSNGGME